VLEKHNQKLEAKYQAMREREVRWKPSSWTRPLRLVAYGTTAASR
jgi:hypothetical protein